MSTVGEKTEQKQVQTTVKPNDIAMQVLAKVEQFQKLGQLDLPKDYSAGNALNAAYLHLSETKDKDGKAVLEVCSKESIANSLFKMVVFGLSVAKRQCSFIAYGGQLQFQREYAGSIALAKRFGGVKEVTANVIYEKDTFNYEIDVLTGRKKIKEHKQDLLNIDINAIKGAYAIAIFEDGTTQLEVMTMVMIRRAWEQGYAKGTSQAHKGFTDQMACKTVINRLCKLIINSSNDSSVVELEEDEKTIDTTYQEVQKEFPLISISNEKVEPDTINKAPKETIIVVEEVKEEKKVVPEKEPTQTPQQLF